MGLWISTKNYTHEEGLNCCFRQWQCADSRRQLHGHALIFKLVFECHRLDDRDLVMDPDGLEHIRTWLHQQFDRTVCVAEDDPQLERFCMLDAEGLIALRILPGIGCSRFAEQVFKHVMSWLVESQIIQRATIRSVECCEHQGDSALYVE